MNPDSNKFFIIIATPIIAIVAYLFWVASYIKIDYYDSFLILLNARCVATSIITNYSGSRPIILPIVLSVFYFLKPIASNPSLIFALSHITMVVFLAFFLFFTYRLYRFYFTKLEAICGVLLVCLNRALIHSAPYCKEDVFAVFLMTAGFYFYLKAERTGRKWYHLVVGIFIALAIGARYNYPLIFPILALYELLSGKTHFTFSPKKLFIDGKNSKWKVFFLIIFPILLFIIILSFHYKALGLSSFEGAFYKYLTEPVAYMMNLVKVTEPLAPRYSIIFLGMGTSWPFLIVALVGIVSSITKRRPGSLFNLLWFSAFFILHTFLVPQKEARFLISLFPPLYFFIVVGFLEIWDALKRIPWEKIHTNPRAAKVLITAMLLLTPVRQTIGECAQFQDPVYHVNFAKELANYAEKLRGPNQEIYWLGAFYTLYPRNYIFHVQDVTYYIYHFYASAISFYTGRYIPIMKNAKFANSPDENEPLFVGPNAQFVLNDGDAVVINLEAEGYETKRIPKKGIRPLYVERVRKWTLKKTEETDGVQVFTNKQFPDVSIKTELTPEGFVVEGKGLPSGRSEIYLELENANITIPFAFVSTKNRQFRELNTSYHKQAKIRNVIVFFFDSMRKFEIPRNH